MGWIFPGFFVGPPLLLIGTGALQKVRWAHARTEVLAVADHPPARGETQHLWIGSSPPPCTPTRAAPC
ncbi:hypothetical protein [Mycolicibacterium septicum]|uniref:hypothetical protein n=1 Tax=Mycolicibacterium septicum TaxID=98668 RepID=UPI001AF251C5|nr:hypothetical protein [Mycolicibacterium septicum]QRY52440.1 hypothetical protein JVX95_03365 [Mycolicibacterium septicum]